MEVKQIGNLIEKSNYKNPHRGRVYSPNGLAPTLTTMRGGGIVPKFYIHGGKKYRIRRLIPKECYRLMGFSDEDFQKAQKALSDTRLYSTAGNSIVVDVLMAIFKEML